MKNRNRVDVDDWPQPYPDGIRVGEKVWYGLKQWTVEKKLSNTWHHDKPTFILKRGFKRIEV